MQIVWSSRRGSRSIEHLGSAHDAAGLAALKAAAAQRLAAGQAELDLGVVERSASEPLPITSSRAAHLWEALCRACEVLGFDRAAGADELFHQLVLARIIEPTAEGRKRLRGARAAVRRMEDDFLAELPAARRATMLAALRDLSGEPSTRLTETS